VDPISINHPKKRREVSRRDVLDFSAFYEKTNECRHAKEEGSAIVCMHFTLAICRTEMGYSGPGSQRGMESAPQRF